MLCHGTEFGLAPGQPGPARAAAREGWRFGLWEQGRHAAPITQTECRQRFRARRAPNPPRRHEQRQQTRLRRKCRSGAASWLGGSHGYQRYIVDPGGALNSRSKPPGHIALHAHARLMDVLSGSPRHFHGSPGLSPAGVLRVGGTAGAALRLPVNAKPDALIAGERLCVHPGRKTVGGFRLNFGVVANTVVIWVVSAVKKEAQGLLAGMLLPAVEGGLHAV